METTKFLKSLRARKNYTQEYTSKKLSVTRNTYISYENNPLKCPLDLIFDIVKILDGNIEDFFLALKQDYMSYYPKNILDKKEE